MTNTVVYDANSSTFQLNIGTAAGDEIIRESKRVFIYQPGKSQQIFISGVFKSFKANVRQRMGYFGSENGVYFEQVDSVWNMVLRSSVTGTIQEIIKPQSTWNVDRLDGSNVVNPSGLTLVSGTPMIFFVDLEWMGMGTVRVGFVINGVMRICHQFHHANIDIGALTYATTASLPLRYELTNLQATADSTGMTQGCASVISEGGYNNFDFTESAGTGLTEKQLPSSQVFYPVVSIRMISSRLDAVIIPRQVDCMATSNTYYRWRLLMNAVLTGSTFAGLSATGTVQIDTAATALSGGTEMQSGYFRDREITDLRSGDYFKFQLGRFLTNPQGGATGSDHVTLAIAAVGDNHHVLAQLGWQELT